MDIINTKIATSGDDFSNNIVWNYDGLVNNRSYMVDFQTESQNENKTKGMIEGLQKFFYVDYQKLILKNKPILTELCDKSAVQIDWAGLYQNTGSLSGVYSYISDFILKNNTALSLGDTGVLQYTSTIPTGFTLQFMIKLSTSYNGIMFTTTDNNYQIGYDGGLQKFYLNINGTTQYLELIKITENPFYITAVYDHIIIRQYNIYNKVDNIKNFNVSDLKDFPVAFMVQANN